MDLSWRAKFGIPEPLPGYENIKIIEKSNKSKSQFLEKKSTKSIKLYIKKNQRVKTQITKIRNEREDISINLAEIKKIKKKSYNNQIIG